MYPQTVTLVRDTLKPVINRIITICTLSKSSQPEQKKVPYRVRVSIKNLNIRKGSGTHFAKSGSYTGVGVFTIVTESTGLAFEKGWGKLKSDARWIGLNYAKKI